MGNTRKIAYSSPKEEEYIFNCLMNFPEWHKSRLSPAEQKIFKTEKSIRYWVRNATSDQKKVLLAKGGFFFVCFYIDNNNKFPLTLSNYSQLYKSVNVAGERQKIIDNIQEENIFSISSREVLEYAFLIAQNCHSPYWSVNYNYKRINSAIDNVRYKNLGKSFTDDPLDTEIKELEASRDIVINFFLESVQAEHYIRNSQKLDMLEIQILGFLFMYRNNYIETKAVHRKLYAYKAGSISAKLNKLARVGYIAANKSNPNNKPSYTIAELGILAVSDVIEKLSEKAVIL